MEPYNHQEGSKARLLDWASTFQRALLKRRLPQFPAPWQRKWQLARLGLREQLP